jgi:predicted alpha/beta-fold hydrolase
VNCYTTTSPNQFIHACSQGFNQIYDWNLASSLKRIFAKHSLIWRGVGEPFKPELVPSAETIEDFDEYITIHSFGKGVGLEGGNVQGVWD